MPYLSNPSSEIRSDSKRLLWWLFRRLALPAAIEYVQPPATGTQSLSDAALSELRGLFLRPDGENEILKALDTALLDAASLIAPNIEEPGTHSGPGPGHTDGRPTIADTLRTAELFVAASDDALASARTPTSGEAGLMCFLTLAVVGPANRLLRQFEPCLPEHHWLQWRAVGRGTAGKPDFELVLFARYPGTSRIYEKVLALIECKTTDSLPDEQLVSLPDQVQEGFFSGPEDVWRDRSVGHADPMEKVTVQTMYEMHTRHVRFGIITNYSSWIVLRWGTGDASGIYVSSVVTAANRPPLSEPSRSPLGLLVAVALSTLADWQKTMTSLFPLFAQTESASSRRSSGGASLRGQGSSDTIRARPNTRSQQAAAGAVQETERDGQTDAGLTPASPDSDGNGQTPQRGSELARMQHSPPSSPEQDTDRPSSHRKARKVKNESQSWLPTPPPSPESEFKTMSLAGRDMTVSDDHGIAASYLSHATLRAVYRPIEVALRPDGSVDVAQERSSGAASHHRPATALRLSGVRSHGASWICFEIDSRPGLILKISKRRSSTASDDCMSRSPLSAPTDIAILSGPLKSLQGYSVPRMLAAYADGNDHDAVFACVMTDAGMALDRSLLSLPSMRRAICHLYKNLHAAGVLHGDVELRHIMRSPSGLQLIDFDRSKVRSQFSCEAEWSFHCEREMRAVEWMVNTVR